MYANGGLIVYRHTGFFMYLPLQVYHNDRSIANILLFKDVMSLPGVTVHMENGDDPAFILHYRGREVRFTSNGGALFHCSIDDLSCLSNSNSSNTSGVDEQPKADGPACFATVRGNEVSYSKKDHKGARLARDLQRTLLWPSDNAVIKCIESEQIESCSVRRSDILRVRSIYGPPVAALQGKLTRPKQFKNDSTYVAPAARRAAICPNNVPGTD